MTAFETVALERLSSAGASAKERSSVTFVKTANPSKSGSWAMIVRFETSGFHSYYF
jgi:hypothetical protein